MHDGHRVAQNSQKTSGRQVHLSLCNLDKFPLYLYLIFIFLTN